MNDTPQFFQMSATVCREMADEAADSLLRAILLELADEFDTREELRPLRAS